VTRRCAYCGHSLQKPGDLLTYQQRMVADFLESSGRPMSAERIAAHIRVRTRHKDRTYREECNMVRVVVCGIRDMLGRDVIETVKGQGYLWIGEKQHGKARTQEKAGATTTERAVAAR
jgi:hypothetical protein